MERTREIGLDDVFPRAKCRGIGLLYAYRPISQNAVTNRKPLFTTKNEGFKYSMANPATSGGVK